jgi:hypothetical protein
VDELEDHKPHHNVQELVPFDIAGFALKDKFLGFHTRFFDHAVLTPLYEMQSNKEVWNRATLSSHLLIKAAANYSLVFGRRQIIETVILFLVTLYVVTDDIRVIQSMQGYSFKYKQYMDACMVFDTFTWLTVLGIRLAINVKFHDYSLELIGFISFVCVVFNLFFGLTSADLISNNSTTNESLAMQEAVQTIVETSILIYYWWSNVLVIRETKKLKYLL